MDRDSSNMNQFTTIVFNRRLIIGYSILDEFWPGKTQNFDTFRPENENLDLKF